MNHVTTIPVDGQPVTTLADILPPDSVALRMLIIGKTPTPDAVARGHYHQGAMGKSLWKKLAVAKVFCPVGVDHRTVFEDDQLADHGVGITDIVKKPHATGSEPSATEYQSGGWRTLQLIKERRPQVALFVYKGALNALLKLHFHDMRSAQYGFNDDKDISHLFKPARVFAFPMPGAGGITKSIIERSILELSCELAFPAQCTAVPAEHPFGAEFGPPASGAYVTLHDLAPNRPIEAIATLSRLFDELAAASYRARLAKPFVTWVTSTGTAAGPAMQLLMLPYAPNHHYRRIVKYLTWPFQGPVSSVFPRADAGKTCLPFMAWDPATGVTRFWFHGRDPSGCPRLGVPSAGLEPGAIITLPSDRLPPRPEEAISIGNDNGASIGGVVYHRLGRLSW